MIKESKKAGARVELKSPYNRSTYTYLSSMVWPKPRDLR